MKPLERFKKKKEMFWYRATWFEDKGASSQGELDVEAEDIDGAIKALANNRLGPPLNVKVAIVKLSEMH